MKEFVFNEKDWKMINSWNDMTLGKYIEINRLLKTNKDFNIPEMLLFELIEILSGAEFNEFSELPLELFAELSNEISFIQDETPEYKNEKHLKIGDIDYVFSQDFNKITTGEYLSIKSLSQGIDNLESILNTLTIILRPGKLIKNEETGGEEWKQDKFDVENISYRKELFKDLKLVDVLQPVLFFSTGKSNLTEILEGSIQEEVNLPVTTE